MHTRRYPDALRGRTNGLPSNSLPPPQAIATSGSGLLPYVSLVGCGHIAAPMPHSRPARFSWAVPRFVGRLLPHSHPLVVVGYGLPRAS